MVTLTINDRQVTVEPGTNVIRAEAWGGRRKKRVTTGVAVLSLIALWVAPTLAQQIILSQITNTRGGDNEFPAISADGRRIAFTSDRDLTPGAPGNPDLASELFLWTQGVGFTQLSNTGSGFDQFGFGPKSINADGTRIASISSANLTGENPPLNVQLFLWTEGVGFTQLTHTVQAGFGDPVITADGTRIAFDSNADLTGENPDGNHELFLWTEGVGFTQLTNLPSLSTTTIDITAPSISADGRRIAFMSDRDLTPGAPGNADGNQELFLWTEGMGFTQLTNTMERDEELLQTAISRDGRRIAFTMDRDLTPGAPGNPEGNLELFLWTEGMGFTQLTNTPFGKINWFPAINADGTRVAFLSSADLTPGAPGNADGNFEVFLWREGVGFLQLTETTELKGSPKISADGTRITFDSTADLTPQAPGNRDGNHEIFLAFVGGLGALPDFVVEGLQVTPGEVDPGSVTLVHFDLRNWGGRKAGGTLHRITLDGTQVLAQLLTGSLSAGGLVSVNRRVRIPTGTPPGLHMLQVVVDGPNRVAESDEANNTAVVSLTVR